MSDLISRSALIKAMENKYDVAEKKGLYAVGLDCGFIITEQIINEQPAVEAKPVVRGEWIDTQPEYHNGHRRNAHKCSNCQDYYTTAYDEMNFCPNCGADMRKSEN